MNESGEQTRLSKSAKRIYSPCCPIGDADAAPLPVPTYILAGGVGSRLGVLTADRPKPVVPFAGHHRIIDFTLSNCANSGITDATLLTQHLAGAIESYVGDGRAWGFTRPGARLRILPPRLGGTYEGTADAVRQRLPASFPPDAPAVLVLAADHIYEMEYGDLVRAHLHAEADVTIGVMEVSREEARNFGVVHTAPDGSVVRFEEKPVAPTSSLVSMGIYVFRPERLRQLLSIDAAETSAHDFGHDILPLAIALGLRVQTVAFDGYWRDVGTPESYWTAHRDLLLAASDAPLASALEARCTHGREIGSLVFGDYAVAHESSIFGGCVVDGIVERSVLGPGVRVARGAVVRDSVLLAGARVEEGAVVDHAILDEHSVVGRLASVGVAPGPVAIGAGTRLPSISVVAARTRVAARTVVPRGSVVSGGPTPVPLSAPASEATYVA